MTPDLDMQEAARLIDRARDLLLLHRDTHPGVRFFVNQWAKDVRTVENMARLERSNHLCRTERLFA